MSQCVANLQPKVAGVRIDEAWCYTSIASVPMYEVEIRLSHLPRLLNHFIEHATPYYGGWVVSVEVNGQLLSSPLGPCCLNSGVRPSEAQLGFWQNWSLSRENPFLMSDSPYKGTGVEADIVRPQHDGKDAFPKAQVQEPDCE